MKNYINNLGLFLAITLFSASAYAIPTFYFDGTINYDASTGLLDVESSLTATEDITPGPNLVGSELNFTASFDSVISTSSVTVGLFSGVSGDDLFVALIFVLVELFFGSVRFVYSGESHHFFDCISIGLVATDRNTCGNGCT